MPTSPLVPKPAVSRGTLVATSGVLWLGVGVLLATMAGVWIHAERTLPLWPPVLASVLALVLYRYALRHLVDRNLARIRALPERPCAFAFMPARNYLLVAGMMAGGILLRHSALPKIALVGPYLGMGTALGLGSLRYLRGLAGIDRPIA